MSEYFLHCANGENRPKEKCDMSAETTSLFRACAGRSFVRPPTHPSFVGQALAVGPLCALHCARRQCSWDPVISRPRGSGLMEPHSLDFSQNHADNKRKSSRAMHSTGDRGAEVNAGVGS